MILLQCLQGNKIVRAAQAGNIEAVRRCLDGGTDVNSTTVIFFSTLFSMCVHDN